MSKGLQKVKLSFEDSSLTHYGGMLLFQQFCQKLGLRRLLQRHVQWQRRSNHYHPTELILTIIYIMVAGMKRISETRILPYNGYFQDLLGLNNFPDASTLRKFLKGLSIQEIKGLMRIHDMLRQKMFNLSGAPSSLILDLDSTVLPLYGWQIEEANIGYNPKKWGRPSYHPLICFEGHTRDTWHGVLRPGDTYAATDVKEFWESCCQKIPKYQYRIRLRADGGFYDHKFIEPLDEQGIGYAIAADMTKPVKELIQTLRYRTFNKTGVWQAAKFTYQPSHWKKPHQFYVIRRPKPDNKNQQEQRTLWQFKDYFYHTLVSNLPLSAPAVWYFYKKRCRAELDIRELKESFPLSKIPTNSFSANQAYFHLILLAYDLISWFKRLCLPPPWSSATLQTIRMDLFFLAARLVNSAGQNQLKLPSRYPHQKLFMQTLRKINQLKIP